MSKKVVLTITDDQRIKYFRQVIDKLQKPNTRTWMRMKFDKKLYNKQKFEKFFNYITDHNFYREGMEPKEEDDYIFAIKTDEFLMQILEHVRYKKFPKTKGGPKRVIDIDILKIDIMAYISGEWQTKTRVPSIAHFCGEFSTQRINEKHFYKYINAMNDEELSNLKDDMLNLRKHVVDEGAMTNKFNGYYASQAMKQKDVSEPHDQEDVSELDGKKKGWASLLKEAFTDDKEK